MKLEELSEAHFRSRSFEEQIEIQKIKRVGKNRYAPDAINFYQGEVTFGKKPKFRKKFQRIQWSRLFWRFNLSGFAEMFFLDPEYFNGVNYDLLYEGDQMLLGRRCWVYRVGWKPGKGWHFAGRIWVLPQQLVIIRACGSFQPMRRVLWFFPVEDYWFAFDLRRKESAAGKWMPDYVCAGMDPATSDFTPAFTARIIVFNPDRFIPSPAPATACAVGMSQSPVSTTPQKAAPQ